MFCEGRYSRVCFLPSVQCVEDLSIGLGLELRGEGFASLTWAQSSAVGFSFSLVDGGLACASNSVLLQGSGLRVDFFASLTAQALSASR